MASKNKNRTSDSKRSSQKNTLNPPGGGKKVTSGAPPEGIPSTLTDLQDPDRKIGQFTGRGSPGLQKK